MSYLGDVAFSVYHGEYWVKLYNGEFTYFGGEMKITGMQFWQKLGCVVKPPAGLIEEVENRKGRKPKPKRKKGQNESPKKKVSREKRIMHCGRCGIAGHNAKNCKNFGVPKFLKPRKRMSSNTGEDGYESTNTNG
ncbi:hypothetical protein IGI04_010798 [Brassica rapa subsp. trilocularis]|uniref:CCHC-type domain-containing protein n=1 Tax=Brassica rapa subsp. trilocularis TaxID=1813537 RepID=A0ABQ7N172_BRACM|nr:hypothetical protein IGI04_010798 [Brassica rapa subsp. trilocularis]